MFSSWLSSNNPKPEKNKQHFNPHFILETPIDSPVGANQDEILFGCGCFWGAEKGFWKLPGVVATAVGYAGGSLDNPNYNQVCSGRSGHAEVVRVLWDKNLIHLTDLLKMFWECHDPTQGNRQGNDRGSQYRSSIYYTNSEHLKLINESMNCYQKLLSDKGFGIITTEIKQNQLLYYAEEYHQQYLAKPGSRPYCSAMPTKVSLGDFTGASYKLKKEVWENFNWNTSHCVLRSNNNPIKS